MVDAVVVAAVRTPVGRRGGALSSVHPADLSGKVLSALVTRVGLDPATVDDVIWGCVSQVGEQTSNIGRSAVLAAGWPESVPAVTIDRQCGSSQQAISFAAAGLLSGQYDVVVAGGVESMSRVPLGSSATVSGEPFGPTVLERYAERLQLAELSTFHQGVAAELIAEEWELSRTDLDEYSMESHRRAAAAADSGVFDAELVPITLADGTVVQVDGGIRRETTMARLAQLPTPFHDEGVVTAGSASQMSDGAAALLLMTTEAAARLHLAPLARVHTSVVVGSDPVRMLTGPIPATEPLVQRSGVSLDEISTFEVNEAFAPVPLAWLEETGVDPELLNPSGGAIALGHPLGATGARLATTLVHRLHRTGGRYGLLTMCEGGGQANATLFEGGQ